MSVLAGAERGAPDHVPLAPPEPNLSDEKVGTPTVQLMPMTVFVCPICGKKGFGVDAEHQWCNDCRAFTGRCSIGFCADRPAVVAGNVAVCRPHGDELGLEAS